jgi:hypothetical protein
VGRPVVVQNTGFSRSLPTGQGLLSFCDPAHADAAIEVVSRDYEAHCRAACALAEAHFDARRVLPTLYRTRSAATC